MKALKSFSRANLTTPCLKMQSIVAERLCDFRLHIKNPYNWDIWSRLIATPRFVIHSHNTVWCVSMAQKGRFSWKWMQRQAKKPSKIGRNYSCCWCDFMCWSMLHVWSSKSFLKAISQSPEQSFVWTETKKATIKLYISVMEIGERLTLKLRRLPITLFPCKREHTHTHKIAMQRKTENKWLNIWVMNAMRERV